MVSHSPTVQERLDTPKPHVTRRRIPLEHLDPDAVKVVRRLVRHRHLAYLVGGCVRDLLLGCRPKDFDVATSASPSELRKLFRNCRIIGRRFRLAHMLFRGGKVIEVATFRSEPPESQNSDDLLVRRDNVFGEPHEDALRRDFTINGLFYDLTRREIIDYVNGLDDVERRLLRTIGDPDIRLQEDPIRLLRAIKFTARQDLGMDPALYEASLRHRGLLARAAPARVLEEIFRLLRGGAAHRSFWLAQELGVLAEIVPELAEYLDSGWEKAKRTYANLQALDAMVYRDRLPCDAVLLTALLEHPIRARATGQSDQGRAIRDALCPIAERLVMPRRIREQIRQIMVAQRRLDDPSWKHRGGRRRRDAGLEAVDFYEIALRAAGHGELQIRQLCAHASRSASRNKHPSRPYPASRRRRPRRP